jgi:hypothetical protein
LKTLKALCSLCLCGKIFFFFAGYVFAQNTPLETVNAFIDAASEEARKEYICCKMLEMSFDKTDAGLFRKLSSDFTEKSSTGTEAVVTAKLKLTDEQDKSFRDTMNMRVYFFLKKEEQWVIEELRAMLIPDKNFIEKMTAAFTKDKMQSPYLDRLRLYAAPDEEIIQYFTDNSEKFNSLLPSADSIATKNLPDYIAYDSAVVARPWLPSLLLSDVYKDIYFHDWGEMHRSPGTIFFEIENYGGAAVGFLYTPEGVPVPSGKYFVTLTPLSAGWYFYRLLNDLD